jgi:hypothetical protein
MNQRTGQTIQWPRRQTMCLLCPVHK